MIIKNKDNVIALWLMKNLQMLKACILRKIKKQINKIIYYYQKFVESDKCNNSSTFW